MGVDWEMQIEDLQVASDDLYEVVAERGYRRFPYRHRRQALQVRDRLIEEGEDARVYCVRTDQLEEW